MKKLLFASTFALFCHFIILAQPCLPEGITFSTQTQIDNFQINYPGCTEIEGWVRIGNYTGSTDITNLNGLSVLTSIWEDLRIYGNDTLTSLAGLENLTSIGEDISLGIFHGGGHIGNTSLSSLEGLSNLGEVGGNIYIAANDALIDLSGLGNLNSIGGNLEIYENESLNSLAGLENITYIDGDLGIGDCILGGNPSLTNLTGLNNLDSVGGSFRIEYNLSLTSLTGLENLVTIGISGWVYHRIVSNFMLTSLTGLDNLTTIEGGQLQIAANGLTSLTGLNNVTFIGGSLGIEYNTSLTSLTGLDNVTSIEGSLFIYHNDALTNLMGLDNVISIDGTIGIDDNSNMISLTGMDNIEAASINYLNIYNNSSLSTCEVQSVCDYLASPSGLVNIHDNAPGCNSQEEIEEACEAIFVNEISLEEACTISPNPIESNTLIEYSLHQTSLVTLKILDLSGREVVTVINEFQQQGKHSLVFNSSELMSGVYFCVLKTNIGTQTIKIIKLN